MKIKTWIGLALGIIGFLLPLLIELPGLGLAGRVTLGIFLMAAAFWLLEPIPIYTTSLLVIFLEVLLLSAEGPLVQFSQPPAASPRPVMAGDGQTALALPASAVTSAQEVLVRQPGALPRKTAVDVLLEDGDTVWLRSAALTTNSVVVTEPRHWLNEYRPTPFRNFFGALADPIIILFMGGCLLADASVKYRLDRSMTRFLLKPLGTRPSMVVLGLMCATGVLSAFMSNTATTAMMMTVVLPILARLGEQDPLRTAVILAIPVGANIGGIATPIGTPPNAIALSALNQQGLGIAFSKWVIMAMPIVIVTMLIAWVVLMRLYPTRTRVLSLDLKGEFDRSGKAIGLYVIFGITALLWFTENQHGVSSSIVAFLPVVALPMFGIVGPKEIRGLPWEVLWLMAGGISLGTAIQSTGLAQWMVGSIEWTTLGAFTITLGLVLFSFAMANFLSHTVTVTLLAPIGISVGAVAGAATGFDLVPALIGVAVVSSYGMTLPISTPPNAIAMSSGMLQNRDLMKAGALIGVIGLGLTLAMAKYYWPLFSR